MKFFISTLGFKYYYTFIYIKMSLNNLLQILNYFNYNSFAQNNLLYTLRILYTHIYLGIIHLLVFRATSSNTIKSSDIFIYILLKKYIKYIVEPIFVYIKFDKCQNKTKHVWREGLIDIFRGAKPAKPTPLFASICGNLLFFPFFDPLHYHKSLLILTNLKICFI